MFLFRLTKIFLAFYGENDEKFPTMPTFAYTYLYLLHKKHFFCMLRVAYEIVLFKCKIAAFWQVMILCRGVIFSLCSTTRITFLSANFSVFRNVINHAPTKYHCSKGSISRHDYV